MALVAVALITTGADADVMAVVAAADAAVVLEEIMVAVVVAVVVATVVATVDDVAVNLNSKFHSL